MRYRTQKGGGLQVVEEEKPEAGASEISKSTIIERFKPAADAITEAWEPFPDVDPGLDAVGPWVVVQKRLPRKKTAGGIITADDSREADGWTERVGKLLAVGHVAFRNVDGTPAFGEFGGWPQPGQMVLIPPTGGTEFKRVSRDGKHKEVRIVMLHWRDMFGIAKDVTL